jgi:hypothetical protein
MTGRRLVWVLSSGLLVFAGLLLAGWWTGTVGDRVHAGGPLDGDGPYIWFYEAREGAVFSDGMQIMIYSGSREGRITSVSVQGGDKALKFLGARVGLPGRPDDFNQQMKGYPPKAVPARFQIPAEGAVLEPDKAYMLILGYQVVDEVLDRRETVTVDYEVGTKRYRRVSQVSLVACPPPLTDTACADKFEPVEELFE